jgi:hypothetical protein
MVVIGIINGSPLTRPVSSADTRRPSSRTGIRTSNRRPACGCGGSPATGAHAVGGGFNAAWVPQLGLALADEIRDGWAMKVTFEHGFITWLPWIGTQVTFT